ncbi:FixH family protein [Paenibacillus gorillae]|uniref:FixH family protein n=1 Tax=Paenibacillus gorillae TaxID=1243662 RepID=UPI0004B0C761|nr:FixH family protein [Paenibacillus gorillae]
MKKTIIGIAMLLMTSACSIANDEQSGGQKVEVEVKPVQEVLLPGRAILVDAHVTQGNDNVADAEEVQIEIWNEDRTTHEVVKASHWRDGVYRAKTIFPESGTYYINAHVKNTDGSATAPQQELIIQDVAGEPLQSS